MTERRQSAHRNGRAASRSRRPAAGSVLHRETVPTETPPILATPHEQTILGFPVDPPTEPPAPAEPAPAEEDPEEPLPVVAVDADAGLYVLRRPDPSAGSLLMVAGAAGCLSLFLPWVLQGQELGLTLVRRGITSAGVADLLGSGLALPLAVAVGGGVLFLLGIAAFRPARSHRVIGVVALVVSLAVAAGIVVRVADLGWDALRTDPGMLCAVVLAGCGVLGALKAMLTPPEFTTDPR
jgi:hypothetical protein